MSELTELLDMHGIEIARIDDTAYLVLRTVYACATDGAPVLYCLESDWPTTQAARMAELLRANSELLARVAELESRLAAALDSSIPPRAPEGGKIPCDHPGCLDWIKPRGMAAHKRQAHGISISGTVPPLSAGADERRKCPHCHARPKASELAAHIELEHTRPMRDQIERVFATVPTADDSGWRCAEKGCAGAFTRDLHDPDFCTQHATRSTNGHAVEVPS